MATFRHRNGKWHTRIVRLGHSPISKTFSTRLDAERWARQIEARIDQGDFENDCTDRTSTTGQLEDRYVDEASPLMRSAEADRTRLGALDRNPICRIAVSGLTPARIADVRDRRLVQVSAGTDIRELAYLSSIIRHARREWGIKADRSVRLIR